MLHQKAELLLVALAARLVNDNEVGCRAAVGEAIRHLLRRTCALAGDGECAAARERLLQLITLWHGDTANPLLSRAAAQLAGLAVDALGGRGGGLAPRLLPLITGWCVREAAAPPSSVSIAQTDPDDDDAANALRTRWQPAYFALKTLEKLAAADAAVLLSDLCEPVWQPAHAFLLHEHAWMRAASARLFGTLLCSVSADALAAGGGSTPTFLRGQGSLLQLGDASVHQLHSSVVSEAAAGQALKNLLWVTMAVLRQPALAPAACASLLPASGGHANDAAASLQTDEGEHGRPDADADAEGDADPALAQSRELCWPLVAIAARLSRLSETAGTTRGTAAMRWFAAVSSQLDDAELSTLLPALLPPVARASEDASGKVHADVKAIAAETLGERTRHTHSTSPAHPRPAMCSLQWRTHSTVANATHTRARPRLPAPFSSRSDPPTLRPCLSGSPTTAQVRRARLCRYVPARQGGSEGRQTRSQAGGGLRGRR